MSNATTDDAHLVLEDVNSSDGVITDHNKAHLLYSYSKNGAQVSRGQLT